MRAVISGVAIVAVVLVSSPACAKKARPQAAALPPAAEPEAPLPPPPPAPAPERAPARELSEDELFARKTLDELNRERPLADVFFDYDSIALREEARRALAQNAEWLKRWQQTRIVVEGHCDERGTPEYNLSLGDQRAAQVRSYLIELGVAPERISSSSKGKEQPFCLDAHEGCWSQNRRGAFLIVAK